MTDRNPKLLLPTVQPSPVEVEHVSTNPDIATTGPLENGSHLVDIVSQGPLEAEVPYWSIFEDVTTTNLLGPMKRIVVRMVH